MNTELSPLQKAALAVKELRARLDSVEAAQHEPVAIAGMACRFPQADGLDAYWRLLSEGRDAIGEVPAERWDLERFFDPNPNAPGKINTRYGGFLKNVDRFDAAFFGISPREAEHLDPQQRQLLEVAWHALEDAGQAPAALRGTRTGVFVGITQMDYGVMQLGGAADNIQAYTGTGNGQCFAAGRLAYVLGVHGPVFSVDTACSSSMVALNQAVTALRNRECDVAIVAGTQLNLTPPMQIFLSKTQSFAPDGRCRTFDEAANGFVLGEGVGVVVLRRLSDAMARGDAIRAVIRATGINHDGPASGLTVPSEGAQEALLRWVLERAGLQPGDIDYVEAHGTATQLGDPIEVGALRSVFGQREQQENALLLGSVKTNFGHLNAAAGIAGLIKVVLMLEHEQVAPNLHFKEPSSRVPWEGFTVRVPTTLLSWPRQEARVRRAGVSSFGLSGTNTHTLIEEAPVQLVRERHRSENHENNFERPLRPLHLLCLSAQTEPALRELASAYLENPALSGAVSLPDICFSAHTGRNHFAYRVALRAESVAQLRERLERFAHGGAGVAQVPKGGAGRMAMLFAADVPVEEVRLLAQSQPRVAATLERCREAYEAAYDGELFSGRDTRAALFACQFALADLWLDWGMQPSAVAGCGIGTLTALCVAGVLDVEQAFAALAGQAVDGSVPQIMVYSGIDGSALPFVPSPGFRLPPLQEALMPVALRALSDAGIPNLLGVGGQEAAALMEGGPGTLIGLHANAGALWPTLLDALGMLYQRGMNVAWHRYDAGYDRNRVRLPGYQFQHQRYWLETITPAVTPLPSTGEGPGEKEKGHNLAQLLGNQLQAAAEGINDVVAQQLQFLRSRTVSNNKESNKEPNNASNKEPNKERSHTLGDWHLQLITDDSDPTRRRMLVRRDEDPADSKRMISANVSSARRSVVFMFPGVGDHYLRMGQGLYANEPVFRAAFDRCCAYLKSSAEIDLQAVLYPPQTTSQATPETASKKPDLRAMLGKSAPAADPAEARLNQTVHSQTLVFIVEYALSQMWLARGVTPQAMIGYSIGEYVAACLSEVMTLEDALTLVIRRARMIEKLPQGVMLAVPLPESKLMPLLGKDAGRDLSLSIVSTPALCVVGGPETAIAALEQHLRGDEVVSRRLPGTHAFHSHMLAPLHDALVELVQGFTLHAPRIPYLSNLTGDWMTERDARDPAYWARHTWQTVRFADGLGRLLDKEGEGRVFLELGPGQSCGSFVMQHPAAAQLRDKIILPSLKNRYEQQPDEAFFLSTLGKLWLAGVTI